MSRLPRQPINVRAILQLENELMEPVSIYRHARIEPVDRRCIEPAKRPRRVVKTPNDDSAD